MKSDPAGLLLVDKSEGPTSHDVVSAVRRAVGVRRVGHTGTLDPFASGLLVLCVGWVTRLAEYLASLPKTYRGVIRLGLRTETDDRTGSIVARNDGWRGLGLDRVRQALDLQLGQFEQIPPAYSAKKVAGRRAYSLARSGDTPELRPESVTIRRLELCDFSPPEVTFEIECSSGTYVRAVARDVGESLGVGAHLSSLRRLRVGRFSVEEALALGPESDSGGVLEGLLPPEAAVAHLQRFDLDLELAREFAHGRPVAWQSEPVSGPVAVHLDGRLLAIAGTRGGQLWPQKVFRDSHDSGLEAG